MFPFSFKDKPKIESWSLILSPEDCQQLDQYALNSDLMIEI